MAGSISISETGPKLSKSAESNVDGVYASEKHPQACQHKPPGEKVTQDSQGDGSLGKTVSIAGLCLMFAVSFLPMLTIPFVLLGLVT